MRNSWKDKTSFHDWWQFNTTTNNNNNNFISIALLSYVQGTLQSLLKNIYKFTTISYYIYNELKKEKIKTKATFKPSYS